MEPAGFRRSYVAALVVPALLLNALTLALAWTSAAGDSELLAEVEVLSELCESVDHDRV
jgi:hypothetical protein